ncbi:glucose PTS transporter subunit EIIB [Demequina globuliformis]|uniref:glucose PTS transporter subunit EIIB n=1 Tax=Demequina globuliformis TaxID=676202 RepID=UPI000785D9C8|nr:glucose PTS transporter subunit EIIB [Demequina globuliformis]
MTAAEPRAALYLQALGGADNIEDIEPCTTRLRSLVHDPSRVDSAALRELGAFGVMINGRVVQVVVGPDVDVVASEIDDLL